LSLIFAVKTHSKALKPTAVCDNEIDYTYEMSLETSHNHECYCMTKGMEDFEHCSEVFYSLLYSYSASFITAVINVVLAVTIKKTASWQLWKSLSSERAVVLISTFIAQFINTCVILVAVELDWTSIIGFNFLSYLPSFSEHTSSHHDPQGEGGRSEGWEERSDNRRKITASFQEIRSARRFAPRTYP